uniref:Activating transcription factor 7 interacting protein 2 n=1 Tax=Iconisemion striatum TaxID=60296 RepID=A0A1A7XEZ5_9TELE
MSDEEYQAPGDSPAGGIRRLKRSLRAHKSRVRSRVNIGVAFRSWRSEKQARGLRSDEAVALCLLEEVKKNTSESHGAGNGKIRISKSQLQKLIEQEVCTVEANNETKIRDLIEAVQQMSDDTSFEESFQKMEAQINLVSKRVEVALAYIKKSQDQSLPSSHADMDRIWRDSNDDPTETSAQCDEEKRKCVVKIEEAVEMMETANSALKEVRVNKEELTCANVEFSPEKAPPTLSPKGSWMKTNEESNISMHNDDEKRSPPTLKAMVSSEHMICTKDLKRELEDFQDEGNQVVVEQLKVKTFKQQEDVLYHPPLPTNPFPATLSIEAASYSLPPKVELNLALIRNPTRLSVLWNVAEKDPAAPPMDSYIIFLTMETAIGSGDFSQWSSNDTFKAKSLPMCALIKKYKPGHKVCAAVVGKDIFGRYGPYSEVVTATIPN